MRPASSLLASPFLAAICSILSTLAITKATDPAHQNTPPVNAPQAKDPQAKDPWGITPLLHFSNHSQGPESLHAELLHSSTRHLGAPSCAATACHGGPSPGIFSTTAPRGSEYSLWLESDPHAKSWQTLNSPRSLEILERLNILIDGQLKNKQAFQNCLACHNTSTSLATNDPVPTLTEGIGCEACHGPAQQWLNRHYQGPVSVRDAIEHLGMINTKSLPQQAKACTLCHVGGPDRDMNHDIIAAGHPALYFDFQTYLKAYPKHWRNPPSADLPAQRWLAGQLAAADSELQLLEARLNAKPHSTSTWPEFSNFQCSSCHHTLSNNPTPSKSLGNPPLREWNLQALQLISKQEPPLNLSLRSPKQPSSLENISSDLSQPEVQSSIHALRTALAQAAFAQTNNQPNSTMISQWNLHNQRHYATSLWQKIHSDSLPSNSASSSASNNTNTNTNTLHSKPTDPNWERASLAYIATIPALTNNNNNNKTSEPLLEIRNALLFPLQSQSPKLPTNINWSRIVPPILEAMETPPPPPPYSSTTR